MNPGIARKDRQHRILRRQGEVCEPGTARASWKHESGAIQMRILILAAALTMAATSGSGIAATPESPSTAGNCQKLAPLEPGAVRRQFEQVAGEVLGKPAERWTIEDFNSVVAAAAACDRFVSDKKQEVRASSWAAQMDAAAKVIIPISTTIRKADDDMGEAMTNAPWLPQCMKMFDWRRTRKSWKNNSENLFGKDFLSMTKQDLEYAKQRAVACKDAVNLIGKARRAGDDVGALISDDISYAVDRSIEALDEETGPKTVTVMEDGQRVPMSYASQKTRMMVGIVNRAIKIGRSMTPDETTELTAWADEMIAKSKNDADIAYARVVKDYISKQMFRRDD